MGTQRDIVTRAHPDGRLFRSEIDPPLVRRVMLVTWDEVPSSRAVAAVVEEVRRQSSTWPAAVANANG
jgi:hypothetical protein